MRHLGAREYCPRLTFKLSSEIAEPQILGTTISYFYSKFSGTGLSVFRRQKDDSCVIRVRNSTADTDPTTRISHEPITGTATLCYSSFFFFLPIGTCKDWYKRKRFYRLRLLWVMGQWLCMLLGRTWKNIIPKIVAYEMNWVKAYNLSFNYCLLSLLFYSFLSII